MTEAVHERQPTRRAYARMVVCFHEAGHAVALWRADIKVDALTVQQGWFSASTAGLTSVKRGQYYKFEDKEAMLGGLAGILAGRVAHERFETEYGVSMEGAAIPEGTTSEMLRYAPDARAAAISAEAGCESDMAEFKEVAAEAELSYPFVLQHTEVLVGLEWPKITEVAHLLFERGRISGRVAK